LKIANRGKEIEEIEQSKATKIHLWINFISQLTRRIEVACESKIEVFSYSAKYTAKKDHLVLYKHLNCNLKFEFMLSQ